jgi:hypothetical protein
MTTPQSGDEAADTAQPQAAVTPAASTTPTTSSAPAEASNGRVPRWMTVVSILIIAGLIVTFAVVPPVGLEPTLGAGFDY